ncbi:MAG: YlxR family protein [Clostridiaceae bacterium]|nr:YlxR family protein [Clostridiaceae bacterium]
MPRKVPQRMCVTCRTMKSKRELIRIVLSQDGSVMLDATGKKPGRGAYVCRSRTCIAQAVRAHRLDKGLKTAVGADVIDQLIKEMEALPEHDPTDTDNEEDTGSGR